MLEVVYYVASSLDGFIATPDGGVEWLSPFEGTGDDYGYAEFYGSVDSVLLGRRTYDKILGFGAWPYPGKPCWVFSHRKTDIALAEVTLTAQSPIEVVSAMAARGLRRAWLVGGAALAASFRADGLITEYVVSVIPVILGSGVPLFAPAGPTEHLKLVESRSYPNGLVQLRYVRREVLLSGGRPG